MARRKSTDTVVRFQPQRRHRAYRDFRFKVSPIMVALPLAIATAAFIWQGSPPSFAFERTVPTATFRNPESAHFSKCWGRRGSTCVIDGDSLNYGGEQIRIADIDAPELGSPECDKEYALGLRAKDRLLELLNSGSFKLVPIDRRLDGYGRALYIITREGHSLGDQMVGEGLAHEWRGHREGWCDS